MHTSCVQITNLSEGIELNATLDQIIIIKKVIDLNIPGSLTLEQHDKAQMRSYKNVPVLQ